MFCLFKYLHVRTFVWCFLLWSTRGTCAVWTEASSSTVTHHSTVLKRRVRCTSHLHLNKPYFCLMLEQTIKSHTHTTTNPHCPGSQSADKHQSYECRLASVHWDSWGTNQAMGAAGECHIGPLVAPTHTHTQKERQHMCPHAQKQTKAYCSLLICTQWHSSQLSAH